VAKLVGHDLVSSRCRALDDIGEPDTGRNSRVVLEPVPDGLEECRLDQACEEPLPLRALVVVPDGHAGRCRVDANADSPRISGKQVGKGLHLGSDPFDDHSVTVTRVSSHAARRIWSRALFNRWPARQPAFGDAVIKGRAAGMHVADVARAGDACVEQTRSGESSSPVPASAVR
jgi:hypothetical protein